MTLSSSGEMIFFCVRVFIAARSPGDLRALVFTGEKNGRCRELGAALSGEYNAEPGTFPGEAI
jgi:hypothetical protein